MRLSRTGALASDVQSARPESGTANLNAAWQPLGPVTVSSIGYGAITGRITAISIDPNDSTGNTVWLGTTGGGVWKSTNAAAATGSVTFAPLTDDLSVFSANEGAMALPSLSIGAVAAQPATTAVLLAGTGDPNDATDSYYGQGILRSADGGQTWTLSTGSNDGANGNHGFAGLATAGLAWSSTAPSTAVAAMSVSLEGAIVQAAGTWSIPGLYYTTDAGLTWQMATVYDGTQIVQTPMPVMTLQTGNNATAVVWDAQRGLFIAALAAHGYYGSPDGITWHRLANQPGTGLTTANCPVGASGAGSANCPILRGALAVQPVTGDLFALTVDNQENDQGLWQDPCSMAANGRCGNAAPVWPTRLDNGALEVGQGGSTQILQGSYDLALAAAPSAGNGTVLFAGTIDLYRCTLASGASACTFRNTTNAGNGCNAPAHVAPAQHALATLAQSSGAPLLLLGNDGGLWRSTDGVAQVGPVCSASDASHFDNLNPAIGRGGSLAEVVGFAQDPAAPGTLLAGLGANGSASTASAAALPAWPQLSAGEGGYPQIDPNQPADWYVAVGAGVNLELCSLGSSCTAANLLNGATVGEPQVDEDAALLDAPTLLDPQQTGSVLAATCRVWRGPAQSGAGWSGADALSPAMDNSGAPCSLTSSLIRSLGAGGPVKAQAANAANTGSEVLYAGMAGAVDGGASLGGHVFLTKSADSANANTPWTDITGGAVTNASNGFNPVGFDISAVVADPHDATGGTVYTTVMGFGLHDSLSPHVYRSQDFGAHWTDISANLPNAPANALVIDPNDANTVYLAMDSGVYVTQSVNTCATANCWSPLGAGLPNAPVTELQAGANIPTGDGRLGMLRAATYGRGLWQTPLLTALPINQPAMTAAPSTLTFAAQQVATQSATQTVTVSSTGNSPLTISSVAITGDFVETDTCTGKTVAVGSTCTLAVSFAPTTTGTRTGLLTIYGNVAGGQATVSLTGTATTAASIVLTPVALTFPSTVVNQTAASEIITVSNTGGDTATLQTPSITGDFTIAQNTCGATLPTQTGCSLVISFKPTASGSRTGVLTVNDSAGTQTAQLSGTGQAPPTDTLTPASLTFGPQAIGSTSAPQQITLTNAGDVALTLIAAAITSGDFTAANGCSSSLAPHSTCSINVRFVPTAAGSRTGVLSISDEVRTQTIPLSGTGVAGPGVTLSPMTITFGPTGAGINSPTQTVTLTNNGGQQLNLTGTTITGDFTLVAQTCGNTLAVGSACTLTVGFTPTAAGPRTGALTVSDNASGGTQTVNLAGTGIDFSLTPNGATSVTVTGGASATFPVALSSVAGLNGSVTLSCSGAPTASTCTVSPANAALGGSAQISMVVQTGLTTSATSRNTIAGKRQIIFLAGLSCLGLGLFRRRRLAGTLMQGALSIALLGVALGSLSLLSGCGAVREIPGSGGSGGGATGESTTPAGTYHLVLTGSSAGVNHTLNMTLTVQ